MAARVDRLARQSLAFVPEDERHPAVRDPGHAVLQQWRVGRGRHRDGGPSSIAKIQ
jgi:hypothetical protein